MSQRYVYGDIEVGRQDGGWSWVDTRGVGTEKTQCEG